MFRELFKIFVDHLQGTLKYGVKYFRNQFCDDVLQYNTVVEVTAATVQRRDSFEATD